MKIADILVRLYEFKQRTQTVPRSSRDKELMSVFREAQRKIGSTRLALFMSGAIGEERKKNYPKMSYTRVGDTYRLDKSSAVALRETIIKGANEKERIL